MKNAGKRYSIIILFEWTYPGGISANSPKKYDEHPINRMQEIREDNERLAALMKDSHDE